jgi:hypothetical protein
MAIWDRFARSRAAPREPPAGRQTQIGSGYSSTLSPYSSRTADVLAQLRIIRDESQALEFLKKVNPDVSMAVWNFVRLANQGNEMQFYTSGKSKARMTYVEDKWREFASRINEISNSGLDGLIDQLHYSSFLLGAMGVEAEVTDDRADIYDVYVVKPQTIRWELGDIDNHKKWVPFQWSMGKKVYLDPAHANFFWVPSDPDIGDPRGSLTMVPVLQAVDFQMQILQDLQAVLHHQGFARNDIEILLEKVETYCPANIKNNPVEKAKWLNNECARIQKVVENLKPDSDYIHGNDTKITMAQGANSGRSLDVRAVTELVDVQMLNGSKQMGIMTNRVGGLGSTESWGSITLKIFCDGIMSCQRGSKRLMEEIARLWLRVNGIAGIPSFKHNVVNWENEEQRYKVKLMEEQFHAIAVIYGWESNDSAAQQVVKAEKAVSDPLYESIKVSFSQGGGNGDNDKHSGPKLQSGVPKTEDD